MRDRFRQIRRPCGGYKVGTELPPGTVRRMLGHVSCPLQSCRGPMPERHSRLYGEIFVKAIPQESYPISRPYSFFVRPAKPVSSPRHHVELPARAGAVNGWPPAILLLVEFTWHIGVPRRPHRRAGKEGDEITQLHSKPPSQPEKSIRSHFVRMRMLHCKTPTHARAALGSGTALQQRTLACPLYPHIPVAVAAPPLRVKACHFLP